MTRTSETYCTKSLLERPRIHPRHSAPSSFQPLHSQAPTQYPSCLHLPVWPWQPSRHTKVTSFATCLTGKKLLGSSVDGAVIQIKLMKWVEVLKLKHKNNLTLLLSSRIVDKSVVNPVLVFELPKNVVCTVFISRLRCQL